MNSTLFINFKRRIKIKRVISIFVFLHLASFSFGQCAQSDTVEKLLNLLTDKGIITETEAAGLISDLRQSPAVTENKTENQLQGSEVQKTGVPVLAEDVSSQAVDQKTKSSPKINVKEMIDLSGDLRLRYDTQKRTVEDQSWNRRRPGFRLRFGITANLLDSLKVGFRLVSGNGLQNTTNQSFDGHGTGSKIFIHRVFADWKPAKWIQIYGGKHKNIFGRTPLVWDTDVNLAGFSQRLLHNGERVKLYANVTQYFIEELDLKQKSDSDPIMLGYQGGIETDLGSKVDLETFVSFYDYRSLNKLSPDGIGDNMTFIGYNNRHGQQMVFDANGNLLNEFRTIEFGAKMKLKYLKQPFNFFGHYIRNTASDISNLRDEGVEVPESDPSGLFAYGDDNRDTGYQFGAEFGFKEKKGDFFAQYYYQVLEDFAFPAVFVDSDFHGGGTNNRGHRAWVRYFLADRIYIQGLLYFTKRDNEAKDGLFNENRGQFDIIFDF